MKPKLFRTSISLPEELYQRAAKRMRELHYNSFSDYLREVIRIDLAIRAPHLRDNSGTSHSYPHSPSRAEELSLLEDEKPPYKTGKRTAG